MQTKIDDMRRVVDVSVVELKEEPNVFAVEVIDYEDDGVCYVTAFYGPRSLERAKAFAETQRP